MMLVRLTGGRLAEVFYGIDYEGQARICTSSHFGVYVSGMPDPPPSPPHFDVEIRVWSKGGHASTILKFSANRLREMMSTEQGYWKALVLDPSGLPVDIDFILRSIPKDKALPYSVGDKVPFELHMSRGWIKKVSISIVEA
jgi:hypothetical protein